METVKAKLFFSLVKLYFRGNDILDEKSENLTLNDIGLASQENISCSAINEIGAGESDTLQLEVLGKCFFTI